MKMMTNAARRRRKTGGRRENSHDSFRNAPVTALSQPVAILAKYLCQVLLAAAIIWPPSNLSLQNLTFRLNHQSSFVFLTYSGPLINTYI